MKVLLDNCVDVRLSEHLGAAHEFAHASTAGWAKLSNGALMATASDAGFLPMVTVDQKVRFQQALEKLPLTVVEINTRDARLTALRAMAEHIKRALGLVGMFRFIAVHQDGRTETLVPRSPAQ